MSEAMDQATFGDQIRQHGKLFYRVALQILRDRNLAEEACQQAMCRAWQKRTSLNEPAAMRGWLVRMIVHESLQIVRRRKHERTAMEAKAHLNAGLPEGPRAAEFELREGVLAAIAALPDPTRDVVVLRMLQGLSGNETAEILGCSPAEISRRLYTGMETLRHALYPWAELQVER